MLRSMKAQLETHVPRSSTPSLASDKARPGREDWSFGWTASRSTSLQALCCATLPAKCGARLMKLTDKERCRVRKVLAEAMRTVDARATFSQR